MTLQSLVSWCRNRVSARTSIIPTRRQPYRAHLELLEHRLAPAVWDGGPLGRGTDWCDPVNWENNIPPGPGAVAQVPALFASQTLIVPGGCSTTMSQLDSAAAIEVHGNATFAIISTGANPSTVRNSLRILPNGTMRLVEGVNLEGPGSLATENDGTLQGILQLEAPGLPHATNVSIPVTNRGLIRATAAICCQFGNPNSFQALTNTASGTVHVRNAMLQLQPGFANDGLIELETNARLMVSSASELINRNRIGTRDSVRIEANLRNAGTVEVRSGNLEISFLLGGATVTNTPTGVMAATGGNISISPITSPAPFRNQGTLTISPDRIFLADTPFTSFQGSALVEGTYEVHGTFRFRNANIVTNAATIRLYDTGAIQNTALASALANFTVNTNTGRFSLYGTAGHRAAQFSNRGTVTIGYPSTFVVLGGTYTQTDGVTTLEWGTLAAPIISLQGGQLDGSGFLYGNVVNAATVAVGGRGTAGVLILEEGSYTQTAAGTLQIDLGGTEPFIQSDLFYGTHGVQAMLAGTLDIDPIDGFQPNPDEFFTILRFEQGISGDFDAFEGLDFPNDVSLYPFTDGFGYYLFAYLR